MLGTAQKKAKAETKAEITAAVIGCALALFVVGEALAANEPWEESYTMNTPYGFDAGEENRAFDPTTRDQNGNRTLVKQYSEFSNTAGVAGEGSGVGTSGNALAVGNQLNVVTNGNNNTVIVNSTQINNGDQEANVLNGSLNLK